MTRPYGSACDCDACKEARRKRMAKPHPIRRVKRVDPLKYEPPADVERRLTNGAPDDVITRAKILPKRTALKPMEGF